mmetsp:Transcript_8207/g.9309  ORF Transcript_8207/g.9309 Transcript_8207/m.9309 type:complete len:80 (+) Transcript_8207:175-414(+)
MPERLLLYHMQYNSSKFSFHCLGVLVAFQYEMRINNYFLIFENCAPRNVSAVEPFVTLPSFKETQSKIPNTLRLLVLTP